MKLQSTTSECNLEGLLPQTSVENSTYSQDNTQLPNTFEQFTESYNHAKSPTEKQILTSQLPRDPFIASWTDNRPGCSESSVCISLCNTSTSQPLDIPSDSTETSLHPFHDTPSSYTKYSP